MNRDTTIGRAKLLGWTVLAVMAAALAYASFSGNFFREGAALLSMPWGQVTLFETYLGYALFGAWIIQREPRLAVAVIWIVALCSLGHLVSGVYLVHAATRARDSRELLMGARA